MYIIEPLSITPSSGLLQSSNVAYPDVGPQYSDYDVPTRLAVYDRWVFGKAYTVGAYVTHFGAVYVCNESVPSYDAHPPAQIADLTRFLPPGHSFGLTYHNPGTGVISGVTWSRQIYPLPFDGAEPLTWYAEGSLVFFPITNYSDAAVPGITDITDSAKFAALPSIIPGGFPTWKAFLQNWGTPWFSDWRDRVTHLTGYPAGLWRRNGVADDGESILPKYPSLVSKYWDAMEPPLFQQFPEIPMGELTTYGGRVWRKRTATQAAYEAPPSAPNDWALQKTSNRFAMFDASVQSQTRQTKGSGLWPLNPEINNEIISVVIVPGASIVDAIALLNVEATSVRVQVQVQAGTPLATVYDCTASMVASAAVTSWYDWFFAGREVSTSLVLDDLPPVTNATITVTITNAGSQAACGACIVGKQTYIGDAMFGASVGIKDYSLKTTDEFGNVTTRQRAYSDRLTVPVRLHSDSIEPIKRLLTRFRTAPVLWVGHPRMPSTIVYGYYKDFSATINYATEATCNLEIEGLT